MIEDRSALVMEVAKQFIAILQMNASGWTEGYFRFRAAAGGCQANASYTSGARVDLISAIGNKIFYERISEASRKLIESFDRCEGLLLLIVNNNFDYEIQFEWDDLNKWEISKINGGTGRPRGIQITH